MGAPDRGALQKAGESRGEAEPWRGDEHRLAVEAAREAGLAADEVALDLFTRGFRDGLSLRDPQDGAIVVRGRTVLRTSELERSVAPLMRYLKVRAEDVAISLHRGQFELRVARRAADRAAPALDSLKLGLRVWLGFGLLGLVAFQWFETAAFVVWGLGFGLGAFVARSGLVSGRAMLAGRLALGLAMLAQEEGLVLPPVGPADGGPTTR